MCASIFCAGLVVFVWKAPDVGRCHRRRPSGKLSDLTGESVIKYPHSGLSGVTGAPSRPWGAAHDVQVHYSHFSSPPPLLPSLICVAFDSGLRYATHWPTNYYLQSSATWLLARAWLATILSRAGGPTLRGLVAPCYTVTSYVRRRFRRWPCAGRPGRDLGRRLSADQSWEGGGGGAARAGTESSRVNGNTPQPTCYITACTASATLQ